MSSRRSRLPLRAARCRIVGCVTPRLSPGSPDCGARRLLPSAKCRPPQSRWWSSCAVPGADCLWSYGRYRAHLADILGGLLLLAADFGSRLTVRLGNLSFPSASGRRTRSSLLLPPRCSSSQRPRGILVYLPTSAPSGRTVEFRNSVTLPFFVQNLVTFNAHARSEAAVHVRAEDGGRDFASIRTGRLGLFDLSLGNSAGHRSSPDSKPCATHLLLSAGQIADFLLADLEKRATAIEITSHTSSRSPA